MEKTTINQLTSRELEEAIVCALLLHPGKLPDVVPYLRSEMFDTPQVAFIYQAMLEQYNRGEQPDFLTIQTEMRRIDHTRTTEQNGIAALGDSLHRVRDSSNLMQYVGEVKRLYLLRRLKLLFELFAGKAVRNESCPLELIAEAEKQLLLLREQSGEGEQLQQFPQLAETIIALYQERQVDKGKGFRVVTGLRELDAIYGGFHNGEMIVLAGRPADGKSAVALHIAYEVAERGIPVVFYSLEMSDIQMMNRYFMGRAGIEADRLRSFQLTENDFERMGKLAKKHPDLPLWISVNSCHDVEQIRAQTLLMKRKGLTGLVIVDYLHMMKTPQGSGQTMDQMVGANAKALKLLALEAGCPVLVLSQMNRDSERRPDKNTLPQLTDLRDSGVIEQAADGVVFVYRPDRHGMSHDPQTGQPTKGLCYLVVRKHRNGATGVARVKHNSTYTRFIDHDKNF